MPIVCLEEWSQRTIDLPSSAQRTFVVTGAANEAEAVNSLPVNAKPGAQHPQAGAMLVRRIKTDVIGPAPVYRLTVNYEAIAPDFGDPTPAEFSVEFGCKQDPKIVDHYGNYITNAAGDPYEGLTRDTRIIYYCVRRYESTWDLNKLNSYKDSFNSDTFAITMPSGQFTTVEPGQAKLVIYAPDEKWTRNHSRLWMAYKLELVGGEVLDPDHFWDGHKTRVPNSGFNGYAGGKKERFWSEGARSEVDRLIELDIDGKPINADIKIGQRLAIPEKAKNPWTGGNADKIAYDVVAAAEGSAVLILKYTDLSPMPYAGLNLNADSI